MNGAIPEATASAGHPDQTVASRPSSNFATPIPGNSPVVASPTPIAPGKVRFTVTWQYNDVVGSRGDTGALVVLIPTALKRKIPDGLVNMSIVDIGFDRTRKEIASYGAYIAIMGGDGKAAIRGVQPGSYNVVILSRNSQTLSRSADTSSNLEKYFTSGDGAGLSKVYFTEVDVPSGDEIEVSHDFGNSEF